MKKKLHTTIIIILVFLIGLSVMLYPLVSGYLNSLSQSRLIAQYDKSLEGLDKADYSEMLMEARNYNKTLLGKNNRFTMSQQEKQEYLSMLDFTGTGMIGILEIDKINSTTKNESRCVFSHRSRFFIGA